MNDLRNLTITSTNPCLIVFLVDQSGSMADKFGNANHSKAVEVANAINENLYEVGLRCYDNGEMKNRFEVAIIGYGQSENGVRSAWEGALSGKWVVSIKDMFNFPVGEFDDKPYWIRPYSVSNTPMTKAFENARMLCNDWIQWGNHSDCHPPIVINITDGEATDGGSNFKHLRQQVEMLKNLNTRFGNVLVLNIHISERAGDKLLFPSQNVNSNENANLLFELSSTLAPNMVRLAKESNYDVNDYSKGYVFNGNANDLIEFLNIGTPK